jgi:cyclophilin family peptidyl-prolyl cis-trans isomerase
MIKRNDTTPRRGASRAGAPAAALAAALLAACGGGGGGGTTAAQPSVSNSFATPVGYTQTLSVTVNGANLDQGVSVTSPACGTLTRSTTAPQASTATTAYYRCSAAAYGTSSYAVTRDSDNTLLSTGTFALSESPQVTFTVSDGAGISGQFVVTLAADTTLTPETVGNFLYYVAGKHYDGTIFHRTLSTFVVQGGGYMPYTAGTIPSLKINTRPPIGLEVNKGLSNSRWTIAMARTAAPNSATTQFYINMVDNPHLDPSATSAGYAVFGHVSAGTDVVSAIANANCASGLVSECQPNPQIVITSAVQTR